MFRAHWREDFTEATRRPELLTLLNRLSRHDWERYFERPVDPKADGCPDYHDVVADPICMREIRRKIERSAYGESIDGLCADVDLCFR